ncbi:MAG: hypothetical protein DRN12_06730, partial [Thermoplasmata archaeon]
IKVDGNGSVIWKKVYPASCCTTFIEHMEVTSDGGFVLVGSKPGFGVWVIRTDSEGNLLWESCVPETSWMDQAEWIDETSDGGFIISGGVGDPFGNNDVWLIRMDGQGNILWNKTFGGGLPEIGYCVRETSDGGFVIAGFTASFSLSEGSDFWIIKTDQYGNKEWGRILDGDARSDDIASCICETSDGGFVVVGDTGTWNKDDRFDVWLVKIMPDNKPPSKPVVTGFGSARINKPYTINISSVDPEGDDIYYFVITWGVGVSGWIGPYHSGETVSFTVFNHAPQGVYNITVKAIDSHGWDSLMSDPLRVTFPKPYWLNLLPSFIQRILLLYQT